MLSKQKIILKGTPASPGIITGKVKIILDVSQFSKMKKGDILVTEMTDPIFLPVMGKAKAIVTDIGGLLCHAAIVSREMRIPCIVNTKNATKNLKDNQKITVNATKGYIYETK